MKNYNFRLVYKKYNKTTQIFKSLLWSIIFGLIVMIVSGYFLGYRAFSVLGWSSEPDIHYGSIVIDYKVPLEELKVGDYVTWTRSGNSFVTHKIIEIDYENDIIITSQTDHFREEGEPAPSPDEPIKYKNIQGKVVATIPEVGNIILGIKNLIIQNRRINILGIISICLTIVAYYLCKKLLEVKTYILKEK